MKKTAALIIALVLSLSLLTACGGNGGSNSTGNDSNDSANTSAEESGGIKPIPFNIKRLRISNLRVCQHFLQSP